MRIRPKSARRNGLTLVEIVAAMATMTMVLGVSVAILTLLLKLSDTGRKHAANEAAIARLARIFREDVRSTESLGTFPSSKPSPILVLQLTDGSSIEYLAERDDILRIQSWDGSVIEQERLALPDLAIPKFERRVEDGRTVLMLLFARRPEKVDSTLALKEFRIDAVLGASSRFDRTGGTPR